MKSMTGYGRSIVQCDTTDVTITIEITSVNRKSLDLNVSAPREWLGLEQKFSEWVKAYFVRARVQVQVKYSQSGNESHSLTLNPGLLDAALENLRGFAAEREIPFKEDASLLFNLAKTLKNEPALPDWKDLEENIKEAAQAALCDLDTMRKQEGECLAADLIKRIDTLQALTDKIGQDSCNTTSTYRDALLNRLKQLELDLDLEDERVLKEIAIHADRADISEELTRLSSHFQQFREFIQSDQACGRKMDFLCQEIHRELNTTGSKSTQLEVIRAVMEGKNELERIREQVQNIE